jgi:hypothetical protein
MPVLSPLLASSRQSTVNVDGQDWSAWVSDSMYPDIEFRSRCVSDASKSKHRIWQTQIQSTKSWVIYYTQGGARGSVNPGEIIAFAPVEAKNCSKPPDIRVDAWRSGDRDQNFSGNGDSQVVYALYYKKGTATAEKYWPESDEPIDRKPRSDIHGPSWSQVIAASVVAVATGMGAQPAVSPLPSQTSDVSNANTSDPNGSSHGNQSVPLHSNCLMKDATSKGTTTVLILKNACSQMLSVYWCYQPPDGVGWACSPDTLNAGATTVNSALEIGAVCETSRGWGKTHGCQGVPPWPIVFNATYASEGSAPKPNVNDSGQGVVH